MADPQQQDWFAQNAPKQSGQDWFAQNAPASQLPAAPGFLESVGNEAGKIIGSQVESYKHGGGAVSSGQVGPHGEVADTFNPLHPIATAGYLVPQPIKNLVQHPSAQTAGAVVGQALPYATSPMGAIERPGEVASAPIRGAAKTGNAVLENPMVQKAAPAAGAIGGYAAGHIVGLPWWASSAIGGVGAKLGKAVQEGARIPGERFGLPPEAEPPPLPASAGGTVSRGMTIGTSGTGMVASPERIYSNPVSTRVEINNPPPIKPSYDQSVFERAAAQPKTTEFGPPPAVGKYQPPERNYPTRGPIQGPQMESAANGPMKADTSKLGPPAGVGKYQPPERVPPPVRTAPIERVPEPEPVPAKPQISMADQIATAKGLGFKNLSDAINRFGFEGWQKILGQETPAPEPAAVQPGRPTPFSTPEVPEAQMHSPWGRPVPETSEALESLEQRKATNANMGSTPKSTSMDQFRGVATPEVPRSPFVKPFNREAYSPETDPTLKSNAELAKRAGRQSTKKDNFENTLADAQKKRWTD